MSILILVLILTLLNGLFSMSEMALTSSRKVRLEMLAKKGYQGAKAALILAGSPNKFLSVCQIGITLINIVIGAVGGEELADRFAPYLQNLPIIGPYAQGIAIFFNIVFVGYITIVLGEMIPKRIGMSKPEVIARWVSIPMLWFMRLTRPFIWLLSATTDLAMRILGIRMDESKVTEEEIKAIIDEGASAGTIEEIEQDIVENVFHLGDKKVGTLMTNRSDIIWLDASKPIEINLDILEKNNHAIYPVCNEELDNVLGIVSSKDILTMMLKKQPIDLKKLVRPVNYFPETMNAYSALEKFKESKIHQGLVVDEYGTLVGIVTINDVFDTLVGDISQEDGSISYEMIQREDGTWLIDGQYPWDDFLKEFGLDDDTHAREGFHTIGGFILHELEELPKAGESLNWEGMSFEVMDMDGMRIDKILVKKL